MEPCIRYFRFRYNYVRSHEGFPLLVCVFITFSKENLPRLLLYVDMRILKSLEYFYMLY